MTFYLERKGKLSLMDSLFSQLELFEDGIWSYQFDVEDQLEELQLRQALAHSAGDYLRLISKSHSIPVMDYEVRKFLMSLPENAKVLDSGGGWGWHFRNVSKIRSDVTIFVLDAVIENLRIAKNIINDKREQVIYVHGTATKLPFEPETFDGYWSVQALQHIPNFQSAVVEAFRILKHGGKFCNYSLQNQFLINFLYKFFGRNAAKQQTGTSFFLDKASSEQYEFIREIFMGGVKKRYSEFLFNPSLRMTFPGRVNSIVGRLDAMLSNSNPLIGSFARQQSFHAFKK